MQTYTKSSLPRETRCFTPLFIIDCPCIEIAEYYVPFKEDNSDFDIFAILHSTKELCGGRSKSLPLSCHIIFPTTVFACLQNIKNILGN